MQDGPEKPNTIRDVTERKRVVDHILRYELFRHRDITERLRTLLDIDQKPGAFNRSTWDILYYLIQCYLQDITPNVTDIYITTGLSKGTAITGLAELERRKAIHKVQDRSDARRRRIGISDSVIYEVELFIVECGERLGQGYDAPFDSLTSSENRFQTREDFAPGQEPLIDLLNQLSHQLRTPLTAIVGFSEMIADETLGPVQPAGYAEYARDIRHAASHLLDAMNNLVDTTLAEYGVNIPLGPLMQIDIEEIVDTTCREAAQAADRRGVMLRRKWSSQKGRVSGDQDRLKQCIRRLIEATIMSTGRGHTIDVETAFEKDTGITLKVISPSKPVLTARPEAQRTIGSPGQNGLMQGLPLIRAIVQAHRGTVECTEEGPRRFVTRIFLPETATARP
ncbi:HAMP domain-containing sensor histidine kinase [Thalassospiraceae bacterium LMO-JJ14]|nr:HAMP domain-containing sensor histidine kinase [Thalassospiraceae bacterium LMO-JJ14]